MRNAGQAISSLRLKSDILFPGLLVSGTIALAATWLAQNYNTPVMLLALLLGMAFHFLHEEGRCVADIEFASKSLLPDDFARLCRVGRASQHRCSAAGPRRRLRRRLAMVNQPSYPRRAPPRSRRLA
jgi:hypothetical protein